MKMVDDFFNELGKELKYPVKIILTGAMAGAILGCVRPSEDIDFEINLSRDSPAENIDNAIQAVSQRLKLPSQYSENIEGWSQIAFLDYREKSLPYKKFGNIDVRVLAPEHWTIGKISRYLPLDQMDVSAVLKKRSISWKNMAAVWGQALKKSPLSDQSREFKNHVTDFLKKEGKKVWGGNFDAEKAIALFKKAAGIKI